MPCNEASATPQSRAAQVSMLVFFASFVTAAALPSDSTVIMTSKKVELGCLGPPHCIKYFHVCPRLLRFFRFFLDSGSYVPATLWNPTRPSARYLHQKTTSLHPWRRFGPRLRQRISTPQSKHDEFELRELMHGRIKMMTAMCSAWALIFQSMYSRRQHHVLIPANFRRP